MATQYKTVFEEMQKVLPAHPSASHVQFTARTEQVEGLHSHVRIRQFHLDVDEPPALAGQDHGPNPVEMILAALGSCQEITYRFYADKLGISLRGISVEVKGDLDLRGFFAVDPATRPGFGAVHATVTIDSPASDEELQKLRAMVDAHCPVLDILSQPTPVTLDLARGSTGTVSVSNVA